MQRHIEFLALLVVSLLLVPALADSAVVVAQQPATVQSPKQDSKESLLEQMESLDKKGQQAKQAASYQEALEYWHEGLALAKKLVDEKRSGTFLYDIGVAYRYLDQYTKALDHLEQALAIDRETGDRRGEGADLGNIGVVYYRLGQYTKALDYSEQALSIRREIGDQRGEGESLGNIGMLYRSLGQYAKALDYLEQALAIERKIGNRRGEGKNLNDVAGVYYYLGQYAKALDYHQQSLAIKREIGDQRGEGKSLNNIGILFDMLGQYAKALDYHEQALAIERKIGDRRGEAQSLNNIGTVYYGLGQYAKALDYFEPSLAIKREIDDRRGEDGSLSNIGLMYYHLEQYAKVLDYYQQALAIQITLGSPEHLWKTWDSMRQTYSRIDQPMAAILAGKQAVNVIQSMRASNIGLAKDQQISFLGAKKHVYQGLAELLIDQGRIPEAEQILAMLKEEEYFDFIRRDGEEGSLGTKASHTPVEQAWLQNYLNFSNQLVTLGEEYAELEQTQQLSKTEQQRMSELENELDEAREAFLEIVNGLSNYFKSRTADKALAHGKRQLGLLEGKQELLAGLGHGAVLIHTVSTEDRLHLLLTTPDSQLARYSDIGERELNRLVNRFRKVLKHPCPDPLPLAQKLYDHLVRPLERDLQQAKAKTLMWSLDGTLRYIPMAALHDGEHYLVDRYSMALYTAAAASNLMQDENNTWQLAGLGVSKKHRNFGSLDAVPAELNGIVREDKDDKDGVIPGAVYLDEAFDKSRLQQVLRENYPALHIASHFRLVPGDIQASHLLLGDGTTLSLETLRKKRAYKMQKVDLLTLSACNTAMGDKGQGGEVESFGVLAQKRGAASVLATLWPVADRSTGIFMRDLYRMRSEDPRMTKAQALRKAQMRFVQVTQMTSSQSSDSDYNLDKKGPGLKQSCAGSILGYSHPFYWAPFILMGNWL